MYLTPLCEIGHISITICYRPPLYLSIDWIKRHSILERWIIPAVVGSPQTYLTQCDPLSEQVNQISGIGNPQTDKIVSIIKSCLDEWKKRRDAKASGLSGDFKAKRPPVPTSATESDTESTETYEARTAIHPTNPKSIPPDRRSDSSSERSLSPVDSPAQSTSLSRRFATSNPDSSVASQPFLQQDNSNPALINSQFLQDIYLSSSGLSFSHGNTIALMPPPSPYEPISALMTSEISPAVHPSQITVSSNSTRVEYADRNHSAQLGEDEQLSTNHSYNPNERIQRMFGINPPWWI